MTLHVLAAILAGFAVCAQAAPPDQRKIEKIKRSSPFGRFARFR